MVPGPPYFGGGHSVAAQSSHLLQGTLRCSPASSHPGQQEAQGKWVLVSFHGSEQW